jgi:hypothetical protein
MRRAGDDQIDESTRGEWTNRRWAVEDAGKRGAFAMGGGPGREELGRAGGEEAPAAGTTGWRAPTSREGCARGCVRGGGGPGREELGSADGEEAPAAGTTGWRVPTSREGCVSSGGRKQRETACWRRWCAPHDLPAQKNPPHDLPAKKTRVENQPDKNQWWTVGSGKYTRQVGGGFECGSYTRVLDIIQYPVYYIIYLYIYII